MESVNYVAKLNEYAHKVRVTVNYDEVGSIGPDHIKTFTLRAVVDGKPYAAGDGKNKKEAKQNAAKNALMVLLDEAIESTEHLVEASPVAASQLKTFNCIGWLNEYGQRNHLSIKPEETTSLGPNMATHRCRFVVDGKEYPAASGRTKKEAKEEAAKLVYQEITGSKTLDSGLFFSFCFSDQTTRLSIKNDNISASDTNILELIHGFCQRTRRSCVFKEEKRCGPSHCQINNRFKEDYDSMERLGKGSFGHVFKARHKLEDKFYAVKVVHYKKETLQEAMALSDLNHCNIVRYHSCWISDVDHQWDSSAESSSASQSSTDSPAKLLYMQMELCAVKTLRVWIDEKNIQNPKKSLRDSKRKEESLIIALQIVSGVEHIHSRMLIHRDLKPANILFSQDNTVKIGDFGLVTPEIEDDTKNQKERSEYKGTPSYMAPEQRGRVLYDRKVDIFALGLIYFELLWNLPISEKCEIWNDVRSQKLPQQFIFHFNQESQMIKSMLCDNPEGRPEASQIKTDIEDYKTSLEKIKTMQTVSRTV
uniref:non-specific serine/threonine protein kinase n=1 Tax=Nothobranchius furzeri TaxID=105023 RepID=A0A8C6P7E6_NOTFU